MAVLQAGDHGGLIATTIRDLGRMKFTDAMSDYQNTIVLKRLMKKNKISFDGGYEIQFNVKPNHGSSARWVGLYATDVVNAEDSMIQATVPYRHITWNYIFDRREPIFNSGAAKVVDLIKQRRIHEMAGAVAEFETRFWRFPASTNTVQPYGLPYWCVKSTTAATTANNDGFNGTVQSGYTTVAGINPTTYTRWRNYTDAYTSTTDTDLVEKIERMSDYTDFMPLVDDIPTYETGEDKGYYTNRTVRQAMKAILEGNNDNLGFDLDPTHNKLAYRRAPIVWVKELEQDTSSYAFYQIDWSVFKTVGLRGEWMKETVQEKLHGQHTVDAVHTDCSFNWICYDRRKLGVISINATELS